MSKNGRNGRAVEEVAKALAEHGATGQVRWLDDSARTAAEAADALGVPVGAIANSLVFAVDGAPTLVLTSGAHRVDTAWLGEKLGATITRAAADDVRRATGQAIGGVSPVGHPAPLTTYVDTALARHLRIWAAAGHPHAVFPTTFDELVRITGGTATAVTPD